MPLLGKTVVVTPMFTAACKPINNVTPQPSNIPKRSRACAAMWKPARTKTMNAITTPSVKANPSSSPTMGKMKSVCAAGR